MCPRSVVALALLWPRSGHALPVSLPASFPRSLALAFGSNIAKTRNILMQRQRTRDTGTGTGAFQRDKRDLCEPPLTSIFSLVKQAR